MNSAPRPPSSQSTPSAKVGGSSQLAMPPISGAESGMQPTDMEIEVEDSLLFDHDAPAEKTDTDFFNDFEDDFDDDDLA